MMLREVLHEIVKNTIPTIKTIAITGTDTMTGITGVDENRLIFLDVKLDRVVPEFVGEFGITNLDTLKGLLAYAGYKTDGSEIKVERSAWKDKTIVKSFEFRAKGGVGADFRCVNPERVPPQSKVRTPPWDITIKPTAAKMTEFTQFSAIFAGVDVKKLFGVRTIEGNLVAAFGSDHATTHKGSMILEEGVQAVFKKEPHWSVPDFVSLMKLAGGQDTSVCFCEKGLMGIEIATPIGAFKYYMKAQER